MEGPPTKQQFIMTAEPYLVAQQLPREFTLQMRLGAFKWHLSAVRMSELEIKMYDLAQKVRE